MKKGVVIIPTYNERGNILILIERIFKICPGLDIIVVDDNSPDKTAEEVQTLKNKFPNLSLILRKKKGGLGGAYIEGFKNVLKNHEYGTIVMMDGDLSHDPKFLPRILDLSEDYDLVIGSRYIKDGGITKRWGLLRRALSAGGNLYLKAMFRRNIRDWTTGYNAVRADALRKLDFDILGSRGYAFISSLKFYLLKHGASYRESPIFFEERRGGESKMSWSIIKEGLIAPWKIIVREFFQ